MKTTLRAQRRADRERLEKKRRLMYPHSDRAVTDDKRIVQNGKILRKSEVPRRPERIDTPTPCSCGMCGNPRRKMGELTRAEEQANRDFKQQLKEL